MPAPAQADIVPACTNVEGCELPALAARIARHCEIARIDCAIDAVRAAQASRSCACCAPDPWGKLLESGVLPTRAADQLAIHALGAAPDVFDAMRRAGYDIDAYRSPAGRPVLVQLMFEHDCADTQSCQAFSGALKRALDAGARIEAKAPHKASQAVLQRYCTRLVRMARQMPAIGAPHRQALLEILEQLLAAGGWRDSGQHVVLDLMEPMFAWDHADCEPVRQANRELLQGALHRALGASSANEHKAVVAHVLDQVHQILPKRPYVMLNKHAVTHADQTMTFLASWHAEHGQVELVRTMLAHAAATPALARCADNLRGLLAAHQVRGAALATAAKPGAPAPACRGPQASGGGLL